MIKNELTVVKIGGNVIDNPPALSEFIDLFAKLQGNKMLIHGGGKKATEVSNKLGLEVQMSAGRRITTQADLEVVTMVYAGLINKTIVSGLQAVHSNAIGLSGADADVLRASRRPVGEIDYGWVGDITHVNSIFIQKLLEEHYVPVFCPLAHNGAGQMLNVNADTVAAEIAIGMSAWYKVNLIYVFEKPGVLENLNDVNSVIKTIRQSDFQSLLAEKKVDKGMIPKLTNCFNALEKGVTSVHITDTNYFKIKEPIFTNLIL